MSDFKTKKLPSAHHSHPLHTKKGFLQKNKISDSNTSPQNEKLTKNASLSRQKKITRRIIGVILTLVAVICIGHFALNAVGNIRISTGDEYKNFGPISFGSGETKIDQTMNILIAGIGGKGHPGGSLTDSLMLAHLNAKDQEITLISIPRDLYVGYNKVNAAKINALYPIGQGSGDGINLLAQKVSEVTGQSIDHYAVIDFSGFKQVVNALGGVEVDVPHDIYDNEYPNESWGWEVFSLKKGLQTLDGNTALKFARSRHSTSDFDRSMRQQMLIRAIKDKALSLGIITNPTKVSDLIQSIRDNLSTDLTVGDVVNIGLAFKNISNSRIRTYNLNNDCSGSLCLPGSYLYQPSMEYFGGAWALIPEGASLSRLSTYGMTQLFVNFIIRFPEIADEPSAISIVTTRSHLAEAQRIRKNLMQLGFPVEYTSMIVQTGAVTGNTRITAYWNDTAKIGFTATGTLIEALRYVDNAIPLQFLPNNEYVTDQGPRIEIILGDDSDEYFREFKNVSYLPDISKSTDTDNDTTPTQKTFDTSSDLFPDTSTGNTQGNNSDTDTPLLPSESSSESSKNPDTNTDS